MGVTLPVPSLNEQGEWELYLTQYYLCRIAGMSHDEIIHDLVRNHFTTSNIRSQAIETLMAWLTEHGVYTERVNVHTRLVFPSRAVAMQFRLTWYR